MPTPDRPYGEDLLDIPQHEALSSPAHGIVGNTYQEKAYDVGGLLTNVTVWTDNTKTVLVREVIVTSRSAGGSVLILTTKTYVDGVLSSTLTTTFTRDGNDDITSWSTVQT